MVGKMALASPRSIRVEQVAGADPQHRFALAGLGLRVPVARRRLGEEEQGVEDPRLVERRLPPRERGQRVEVEREAVRGEQGRRNARRRGAPSAARRRARGRASASRPTAIAGFLDRLADRGDFARRRRHRPSAAASCLVARRRSARPGKTIAPPANAMPRAALDHQQVGRRAVAVAHHDQRRGGDRRVGHRARLDAAVEKQKAGAGTRRQPKHLRNGR